jgi:hypothetical protein
VANSSLIALPSVQGLAEQGLDIVMGGRGFGRASRVAGGLAGRSKLFLDGCHVEHLVQFPTSSHPSISSTTPSTVLSQLPLE